MKTAPAAGGLDAFMQKLGYRFSEPALLQEALTHPSMSSRATEARGSQRRVPAAAQNNQRLEFLGDRVLGLIVTEMLYRAFPREDEGALAKRLAALVRQDGLAHAARALDLGRHLLLSRGEADSGGRDNPATLADACEALIGAIYLDGGMEPARAFVKRLWQPLMEADIKPPQDAKTALQEWAQAAGLPLPVYDLLSSAGPPHDPIFRVEVKVVGEAPTVAEGKSKRAAEQAAAALLIARLGVSRAVPS